MFNWSFQRALSRVFARRPDTASVVNRNEFRDRGDEARDRGDLDHAIEFYGKHLQDFPDDADIWIQKGNCLKDIDQYKQAGEAYDVALFHRPSDPDLHLQRGHLFKLKGEILNALTAYRASLHLSSGRHAAQEIKDLEASLSPIRRLDVPSTADQLHFLIDASETDAGAGALAAGHSLGNSNSSFPASTDTSPIGTVTLIRSSLGGKHIDRRIKRFGNIVSRLQSQNLESDA